MSDDQQIPGQVPRGRTGPSFAFILFLIVIGLAAVFFVQNNTPVEIEFLFFKERATTVRWSILMAFLFGILVDRIFSIWWRRRGNKKNS